MDKVLESKVSSEGRVSIPAELRLRLGIEPGDRIQFLIAEDGEIRLSTARALAEQVWAKNTGGDAVDAGELVRTMRDADQDHDDLSLAADREPSSSEKELLALLFPESL